MTSRTLVSGLMLLTLLVSPAAAEPTGVPTWPRKKEPKPLTTSQYLDIRLAYHRGKVKVLRVHRASFSKGPRRLPRYAGRHELSLLSHGVLLDLVRFSFPLTAGSGEQTPAQEKLGNDLAKGASAKITVRVPWDDRVTDIVLTDTGGDGKAVVVGLKGVREEEEKPKTKNLRAVTFQPLKNKTKNKEQRTRNGELKRGNKK